MQGLECSNGCGHGSHQVTLNAVKVEDSPQISGPGQGALGEVKADPESQQPAQDRAQALARSKPAAALGCTPDRAAAAAGKAKRSRSQAEDAPPKPSAKRSKTTSLSQTYRAQKRSARQRSSNRALEIDAATYADVKPHAAPGSTGRRADLGRQVAQALQAYGPGPAQDGEFGDLLRDVQQCIIIAGGNSAKQKHGRTIPMPYSCHGSKFWPTVTETGIVSVAAAEGDLDAVLKDISFLDIGLALSPSDNASLEGGNNQIPRARHDPAWYRTHVPNFYARLMEHTMRVCASIGCGCGECGAPAFFVWNGKTAWKILLKLDGSDTDDIECGLQTTMPKDWPLPKRTKVYVMPSTSGANGRHWKSDGGLDAWKVLGEAVRAERAARELPSKPECCLSE